MKSQKSFVAGVSTLSMLALVGCGPSGSDLSGAPPAVVAAAASAAAAATSSPSAAPSPVASKTAAATAKPTASGTPKATAKPSPAIYVAFPSKLPDSTWTFAKKVTKIAGADWSVTYDGPKEISNQEHITISGLRMTAADYKSKRILSEATVAALTVNGHKAFTVATPATGETWVVIEYAPNYLIQLSAVGVILDDLKTIAKKLATVNEATWKKDTKA